MAENRAATHCGEVVAGFSVLGFIDAVGFIFFTEAQANGVLQDQRQDSRHDERVCENRERTDCLAPQLVERPVAVEQTCDLRGCLGVAKKPISKVPVRPPTMCTPTTSSAVVEAELELQPDRQCADRAADGADRQCTKDVHRRTGRRDRDEAGHDARCGTQRRGVPVADLLRRAARPAWRLPVATVVVTNVDAAMPPELSAEPALNPYQPNHSRPAPSITNGRLCGRIAVPGQPLRLPSTRPAPDLRHRS